MSDEARGFIYKLNAMERASSEKNPAGHNYGDKREAVLAHVERLARDLAAAHVVNKDFLAALAIARAERDAALNIGRCASLGQEGAERDLQAQKAAAIALLAELEAVRQVSDGASVGGTPITSSPDLAAPVKLVPQWVTACPEWLGMYSNVNITVVPKSNYDAALAELEAARKDAERQSGYRVYKDGNAWCAVGEGFINLQESDAGFGHTPLVALGELIVQEGEK